MIKLNKIFYYKKEKAFTLLEVLIVVGLIMFLSGITMVVINPAEKLLNARNNQRKIHVEAICGAIEYYFFQNGSYPSCVTETETDAIDCEADLVPLYLADLPLDVICGSEMQTGYYIKKDVTSGEVGVKAYCAEEKLITAGNWQEE